jgi:dihydroneopterin aldolase
MSLIQIEGMEFFSYHGHFEEESIIGTKFTVDFAFETDTTKAEKSDNLHDTINYLSVYQTIKKEMEKPSLLIETVARRILESCLLKFPLMDFAEVKIQKLNPPLGGQIKSVSITLNTDDLDDSLES